MVGFLFLSRSVLGALEMSLRKWGAMRHWNCVCERRYPLGVSLPPAHHGRKYIGHHHSDDQATRRTQRTYCVRSAFTNLRLASTVSYDYRPSLNNRHHLGAGGERCTIAHGITSESENALSNVLLLMIFSSICNRLAANFKGGLCNNPVCG